MSLAVEIFGLRKIQPTQRNSSQDGAVLHITCRSTIFFAKDRLQTEPILAIDSWHLSTLFCPPCTSMPVQSTLEYEHVRETRLLYSQSSMPVAI